MIEKIKELLPFLKDDLSVYIALAVVAVVIIALIVIICLACKKKKPATAETKAEVKVEESKKVEEAKKEVKVEAKEEVKEEPVKETAPIKEEVEEEPVKEAAPIKEEVKDEEEATPTKTGRVVIGKYEVFPVNNFYVYRLKASNGENLVTSEIYKSAKGAIAAVETVKKNIEVGEIQIDKDKHGLFQFKLFAQNKRLLVVSATYPSQAGCQSAANSFKKFALISPVVELEEDPDHLLEVIEITKEADKKGGKIIISGGESYDFKLAASNGVVICSSNDFKTKAACMTGIESFKAAVNDGTFFVVKDKKGMFQFKLYSEAGRCVVYGEAYKAKERAISAANSVASFINLSTTVEEEAQ